jgi:hypothetical protein
MLRQFDTWSARRQAATTIAGMLLGALLLAACSSQAQDPGTKGDITLGRSDTAVVVENRSGRQALNVRVSIDAGDAGLFFSVVPTMEMAERRTIPFPAFRTEDGTIFDAATATPKEVKMTAKDTLNNDYEVTIPWERGR